MKFKIIGTIKMREPVKVLDERAGWVKIRSRNGKKGWISQKLFQRGWRHGKRKSPSETVKVVSQFQNIPQSCIPLFRDALPELERHLVPVGDDELELIVSIEPRLHSFRLFLIIDYNPRYYLRAMKRFAQPRTIDLLPYNACIWAMYAYKQALVEKNEKKGVSCGFARNLSICLILRRLSGEEVILQTVEDGVYIYFSPVLIMKKPNGSSFRIMSEDPKKVGLLSAFTLPYPWDEGNREADKAAEVYHFFRNRK